MLFPMVVTVYITWWFLTFFDNFFSVRLLRPFPLQANLSAFIADTRPLSVSGEHRSILTTADLLAACV